MCDCDCEFQLTAAACWSILMVSVDVDLRGLWPGSHRPPSFGPRTTFTLMTLLLVAELICRVHGHRTENAHL